MGFQEREEKRAGKSVAASMISLQQPAKQKTSKGRPKVERETKKRVTLAIFPSLYKQAQAVAYMERRSISDVVSEFLSRYVEEHQDEIKDYQKLKK